MLFFKENFLLGLPGQSGGPKGLQARQNFTNFWL